MNRNAYPIRLIVLFVALLILLTVWKVGRSSQDASGSLPQKEIFTGTASYYGPGFEGQKTASGEIFRSREMTAAHRTLPLGTQVRVTNLANNRAVTVEITDRGPYVRNRIIDLSAGAARVIQMKKAGLTKVRVEVLRRGEESENPVTNQ